MCASSVLGSVRYPVTGRANSFKADSANRQWECGWSAPRGVVCFLEREPSKLRRSLTYDRCSAIACHAGFAEHIWVKIYFADPLSPWQARALKVTVDFSNYRELLNA